ncbi:hypothetical protein GCM10010472_07080 [Pseudonocardia halophobica]|uniref:EamA-like transporter family protein n=1 Tax=Pseudonocardia halophobica TaxID=29401 RepID=A0A9W6L8K3_9PSEU|nr:hypothetical protein [Pseudonocardia halophobica]GLL14775.1 hypothetical protein GCM10017577_59230 [Pseudonocardia halophobica]
MNICFYEAIARSPLGAAVTLEGRVTFAVVMSLSPAVAALAGALVLGQAVTPVGAVAIALVVVACAGAVRWGGRRAAPVEA